MGHQYTTVEDAIERPGWRMVTVGGVPSPWGEAAKGILHVKDIAWTGVRLDYESEALHKWTGQRNGPVVMYDSDKPRAGWAEILLLAERIAPEPALLPTDPAERALAFGLAHEICGEEGLGWSRRLQLVKAGLEGAGGFQAPVAKYLARKYGYTPQAGQAARDRIIGLLAMLADRLKTQRARGSDYYIGHGLTAVDIYSAAFLALFKPLPQEQCPMKADTRAAFETLDEETAGALDAVLVGHRDMVYERWLELPLNL